MGYLQDWLYINRGNECPERFWRWSALTLLGHVVGRKVYYLHGKWKIYPFIYCGLIGDAGSGKSSAKGEVKNVIYNHFKEFMYSSSIQSREDIVVKMGSPECELSYKDPERTDGQLGTYRPFFIIANEFENFLSVDARLMVAFLTDIFDENHFSTGFKGTASHTFTNPLVSILACGTPEWLMTELKMNLFKGGLGRRLILVCDSSGEPTPDPEPPADHDEVFNARVLPHLKEARNLVGRFERSDEAKAWWYNWYIPHKKTKPDDPILLQFHSTKHIMVLKVAMLLALNERPFRLVLERVHLETALAFFDDLVPAIQRLTSGIGRNELAGVGTQLLEWLNGLDGVAKWTHMRITFRRYVQTKEFVDILEDYVKTEQLYIMERDLGDGIPIRLVMLPKKCYETLKEIKAKGPLPLIWEGPWRTLTEKYGTL